MHRLRALERECGNCVMLELQFRHQDGFEVASLMCRAGRRPVEVYRNTELGQPANCPDYTPISRNHNGR